MIFISYRIRDSSRIFQIFPSSKLQKQQVRGVCSAPWLAGQVVAVGNTGASGWRHSEGTLLAPHSGNIPLGKDLDGRKLCVKLLDWYLHIYSFSLTVIWHVWQKLFRDCKHAIHLTLTQCLWWYSQMRIKLIVNVPSNAELTKFWHFWLFVRPGKGRVGLAWKHYGTRVCCSGQGCEAHRGQDQLLTSLSDWSQLSALPAMIGPSSSSPLADAAMRWSAKYIRGEMQDHHQDSTIYQ